MAKLTDRQVRALTGPADKPYVIHYDGRDGIRGFGIRVTKAGAKSWILNYRSRGIERRITLGSFPDWTAVLAREFAKSLKRRIDMGEDPQAERTAERHAMTVRELCELFCEEYLPRKRASSALQDRRLIAQWVLPRLGNRKVADLRLADVERLHKEVTAGGAPVRANRLVSLLSTMFGLAIKAEVITANPAKGLRRNPETARERFLAPDEVARLMAVLDGYTDQTVSDAIRLLLLTGARRGEVLGMRWDQLDDSAKVWVKPAGFTKQNRRHRTPLSDAASAILLRHKAARVHASPFVFASSATRTGHLSSLGHQWAAIRQAAGLSDVRFHDLRHSFASFLASSGLSLPVIGALLGHAQASTTSRYAHLLDGALRDATAIVGNIVAPNAAVIPL